MYRTSCCGPVWSVLCERFAVGVESARCGSDGARDVDVTFRSTLGVGTGGRTGVGCAVESGVAAGGGGGGRVEERLAARETAVVNLQIQMDSDEKSMTMISRKLTFCPTMIF